MTASIQNTHIYDFHSLNKIIIAHHIWTPVNISRTQKEENLERIKNCITNNLFGSWRLSNNVHSFVIWIHTIGETHCCRHIEMCVSLSQRFQCTCMLFSVLYIFFLWLNPDTPGDVIESLLFSSDFFSSILQSWNFVCNNFNSCSEEIHFFCEMINKEENTLFHLFMCFSLVSTVYSFVVQNYYWKSNQDQFR